MNLHGGVNGNSGALETGPAFIERSEIAAGYFYARGNASGVYKGLCKGAVDTGGIPQ